MAETERQWEDLRRDARKIEGDLDVKLSSYAKLGGIMSHGGEPTVLTLSSCILWQLRSLWLLSIGVFRRI
jgi:hypothetical protein